MKKAPRKQSVGAQMFVATQLMKRAHHKKLSESGHNITLEQLGVLEALSTKGDINMSELSKAVWKHNANITRMVDKLEKRKYVIRRPIPEDRRANLICITKKGKHVFEEAIQIIIKTNKENLSCISDEEEAQLLSLVKRIIGHLS